MPRSDIAKSLSTCGFFLLASKNPFLGREIFTIRRFFACSSKNMQVFECAQQAFAGWPANQGESASAGSAEPPERRASADKTRIRQRSKRDPQTSEDSRSRAEKPLLIVAETEKTTATSMRWPSFSRL
jgi:hypothetical protein